MPKKYGFDRIVEADYRAIAFHDIPFEGKLYCVHRGHRFPVGNEKLRTLKGGYIAGTLIGATLFQGRGMHHLEGTHYKRIL